MTYNRTLNPTHSFTRSRFVVLNAADLPVVRKDAQTRQTVIVPQFLPLSGIKAIPITLIAVLIIQYGDCCLVTFLARVYLQASVSILLIGTVHCSLIPTLPWQWLLKLLRKRRLYFHTCLYICLFVNSTTQKLLVKSLWDFMEC